MKHLRLSDAVLLIVLGLLWIVSFAVYLPAIVSGRCVWLPVFISTPEGAGDYPVVQEFGMVAEAETSGLAIGDHLVRLGAIDLRGISPFGFVARVYTVAGPNLRVPVTFTRLGETGEATLPLVPFIFPWRLVPLAFGFALCGGLVLLRRPHSRLARTFFLASFTYGLYWLFFLGGPRHLTYLWAVAYFLSASVMLPLILRTVLLLPEENVPLGARLPLWPWLFCPFGLAALSIVFGTPFSHLTGLRAVFVMNVSFALTVLILLTRSFRSASPIGRRQLKWVVYGLYIGALPVIVTNVITAVQPSLWWIHEIALISLVFIPVCFFIAIVRFNLFDIDRLISVTAGYTLLLLLIIGVSIAIVPNVSQAASNLAGVSQPVAQAITALTLLIVVMPSQRHLRPWIERRFFAQRYAVDQGIQTLLQDMPRCADRQSLLTLVGERLQATLQPESCVIYGKSEDLYTALFVRGTIIPPPIALTSPLISTLQTRPDPLDIDRWRQAARAQLEDTDHTVLDRLRATLALPLHHDPSSLLFLGLGKKQSGDVYTSTDVALLSAVAQKFAEEIRRVGRLPEQ